MRKETELPAFRACYEETRKRLEQKMKVWNRGLQREKNPLIRTVTGDLADLNSGGKLLRGVLITLGYRIASGKTDDYADDLALAFEMFQTGVLIHDDIIDNAEIRRGKFTITRRSEDRSRLRQIRMSAESESVESLAKSTAICAGDLGLYLANARIAESYAADSLCAQVIACFDRIVLDTIRGELLDVILPYELQDVSLTEEERLRLLEQSVKEIYHLKTSCYSVIGPLRLGLLLGGADEASMRAMDRFGDELGIAYQIMDDILGIYSEADYLGKDVGSDISEYKQTILYLYVRSQAPEYYEELSRYYGKRQVSVDELEEVRRIFRESGALDYARSVMDACFARAERKLSRMRFVGREEREILKGFISYCRTRNR